MPDVFGIIMLAFDILLFPQLRALGREKMITELRKYIRMAEEKCKYSSTKLGIQIYNAFLHSLVKASEVSISLLDAF